MNNIYLTIPPFAHTKLEIELITLLAQFEGYKINPVYPENDLFKKYYKGHHPAVLIFEEMDKDPTVVYGFWGFAWFFQNNGLVRC
jgi:hypothetical protein